MNFPQNAGLEKESKGLMLMIRAVCGLRALIVAAIYLAGLMPALPALGYAVDFVPSIANANGSLDRWCLDVKDRRSISTKHFRRQLNEI